jgi:hypothetical protein
MSVDRITAIRHETDAVAHGLDELQPGDLLVVLAEDVPRVLAQVKARGGTRMATPG